MRLAVVVMLVALCGSRADADPAGDAVAEAQRRATANDFLGAAAKYREAFAASPRPDLLCNVGVAYYKARDLPRAQRYLDQCLAIGTSLDRAFIDSVKKVLDAVTEKLVAGDYTPVDVLVQPPTASFTADKIYDEPFVGSRRVWFPYGDYKLTFHAEGHVDRAFDIAATSRTPIAASITLEPAPFVSVDTLGGQGSGSSAGSGAERPNGAGSGSAEPSIIVEPAPPSRVPPIIATTATFAAIVATVVLYQSTSAKAKTAADAKTLPEWQDIADSVHLREKLTWGAGGVALVGVAASVYLWVRATRTPPSHIEVTPTANGATVSLRGRW